MATKLWPRFIESKRDTNPDRDQVKSDLWNSGILGTEAPKKLQRIIYFLVGMHSALRSREEHLQLVTGADSQIRFFEDGSQQEY